MHPRPSLTFRRASREDVPAIVALLADDDLGAAREACGDPLPEAYYRAFAAIERDANQELTVVERDGRVVGALQITFIPGMSYQGGWRAQIEDVRVARDLRGGGVGRSLLEWAIARARVRECRLVQITASLTRTRALRFYRSLGFQASHEGLKLALD
jgi:ribosomal protein S18 acetylase RimI-like enzyme